MNQPKAFIKIPTPTDKSTQNQPNEEAWYWFHLTRQDEQEQSGDPKTLHDAISCSTSDLQLTKSPNSKLDFRAATRAFKQEGNGPINLGR